LGLLDGLINLAIIPEKRKVGLKLGKETKEKITKRYSRSQSWLDFWRKACLPRSYNVKPWGTYEVWPLLGRRETCIPQVL